MSGYAARWAAHNASRQAAIVGAAVELLEESAVGSDLPIRAIAERAGVAKSALYRQFDGKDELERRMRSFIIDELEDVLTSQMDLSRGSAREILIRVMSVIADWMIEHPRWNELIRSGPAFDGNQTLDALNELKLRMTRRAETVITTITGALGVDTDAFEPVPFAAVTMIEATMSTWITQGSAQRPRDRIVADLTNLTVYILDGAARSAGLTADPDEEFTVVMQQLLVQTRPKSQIDQTDQIDQTEQGHQAIADAALQEG